MLQVARDIILRHNRANGPGIPYRYISLLLTELSRPLLPATPINYFSSYGDGEALTCKVNTALAVPWWILWFIIEQLSSMIKVRRGRRLRL
jgi:hypothetical protein